MVAAYIEVCLSNGIYILDHAVELEVEVAAAVTHEQDRRFGLCILIHGGQRMCADLVYAELEDINSARIKLSRFRSHKAGQLGGASGGRAG